MSFLDVVDVWSCSNWVVHHGCVPLHFFIEPMRTLRILRFSHLISSQYMIAPQPLGSVKSTRRWIGKDVGAALQWDKKKIHALLVSTSVRNVFDKHNKEHLTKKKSQFAAYHESKRKIIVSVSTHHVSYNLKSLFEKRASSQLAINVTS